MRLHSLYKSILESLMVYGDELGLLTHRNFDGQTDPVKVQVEGDTKRLVLPSPELLRQGIPQELVAFHPLSEISNRGESEVFTKLKTLVSLRLTVTLMDVMVSLAEVAANKKLHSALPPKLHGLLEALPQADAKFVDNLQDVLGGAVAGGRNRLMGIYIKRGGRYMGEKHNRLAVVTFPIFEELENEDRKVFGVQLRVKDVAPMRALLELILPGSSVEGNYNAASNSLDAPNFESLMLAYAKIAAKINAIIKTAGKYIEDADKLKIDLQWVGELEDIETLRFEIPALDGNKGHSVGGDKSDPDPMSQGQERPVSAAPASTAPAPALPEENSAFNTSFSSAQLRQPQIQPVRPIDLQGNDTRFGAPAPVRSSGGRKMSDLTNPQPPAGYAPQPQYQQPAQTHSYAPQDWQQPRPADPFAQINSYSQQSQNTNRNSAWNSGNSSWGGGGGNPGGTGGIRL